MCPRCGHDPGAPRRSQALPAGTKLHHGTYAVSHPLGKASGFGIVYLAWHAALERKVAIKEYLPHDFASRSRGLEVVSHSSDHEESWQNGLELFRSEARTLAGIEHPQIVTALDFFAENGTAYLVMKHSEGESLDRVLAARGKLLEAEALGILLPILEALESLHGCDLLHRDVKPSNILLRQGGLPLLLDFGTARPVPTEATTTLSRSPGYSALELHTGDLSGPWTDIYAAAATLYHLATGQKPPEAPRRLKSDGLLPPERLAADHGLSPIVGGALAAGLAVHGVDRPQTVAAFRDLLVPPAPGEGRAPAIMIPRAEPKAGEVRHSEKEGFEYVWIPPGEFEMGAVRRDKQAYSCEKPRHKITLATGFWLGRTPVTVTAYRRFVDETTGRWPAAPLFNPKWKKGDHPVVNVSWDDAQTYCRWAGCRLPSEAEWEWAARGGLAGKKYPWGGQAPVDRSESRTGARFGAEDGTVAVGCYAANGYGLFDMAGNVWEWCEDVWHDSYRMAPGDGSAWIQGKSARQVLRGGSWLNFPRLLRVSCRDRNTLNDGDDVIGFRCVRGAFP